MRKLVTGAIAVFGWLSLILQFVLAMTNAVEPEPGSLERFVRFFSYFTVSTNIIVAIMFTSITFLPTTKIGLFFARTTVRAAVTSYITIVGLIYSVFLRGVWAPEGWNTVADHALHDVVPILSILYWLLLAPKSGVTWSHSVKWLIYPIIYTSYSLIRGAFVMWYPYWFVDVTKLGYPAALTNTALVIIAFLIIGLIFVGISKILAHTALEPTT